jgi:hypothetical protein
MQNSNTGHQTISQRAVKRLASILMSIVLLGAVHLVSATRANAQVECINKCEQQLVLCMGGPGGSQQFNPGCLDAYEGCVNACLGQFAGLLD